MPRNVSYSALILRTRSSGESNRDIWMLTAEEGILRATVFGGPKSKLRSHAAPFHSGRALIYRDPARDSRKLSELDVQSWRPGLRELYERAMTADAVAETILASHGGGGSWESALELAEKVMDALAEATEEFCARVFIYFLWHWAGLLGIQPDLEQCGNCGARIQADTITLYSGADNSLCCPACARKTFAQNEIDGNSGKPADYIQINPGCRRWLLTASGLPPAGLSRYTMDTATLREAKTLSQALVAGAVGRRPASWDW